MGKKVSLMVIWIMICSFAMAWGESRVRMLFFYSEKCEHCQDALRNIIPMLVKKYPLDIKYLEVNNPSNFQLLLQAEELFDKHQNKEYPIIFFDKYVFSGLKDIALGLEQGITEVANHGGCEFPDLSKVVVSPQNQRTLDAQDADISTLKKVYAAYFYQVGCKLCSRVTQDIDFLKRSYPQLIVREYDIQQNKELNEALCEFYNVEEKFRLSGPMIFIGGDYLHGDDVSFQSIKSLVEKYASMGTMPPWEIEFDKENVKKSLLQRFLSIGILTILVAGFLDGINPCAFATMVFFISYLTVAGRSGKEIIYVGISFTAAIFLTYFAVGLGFFHFIKSLGFVPIISKIVYMITIGIALVLGILSFHDAFKYRKEEFEASFLSLPNFLRQRLNKVIVRQFRIRNFVIGAFATGCVVSLLEFACTGQVYLPTIIFATKLPEFKMHGLGLLLLYNIAFIIPLIAIFILAYRGVTSQNMNVVLKKYAPQVKAGMGVFFVGLAVLLYVYL
jgi:cytochrome c biogenesis protein CcdA/thiol-disulfide isomerase/thioredoxin